MTSTALQPRALGERLRSKALAVVEEHVRNKGSVIVDATWRFNDGEWITTTGEVFAENGQLCWRDRNHNVMKWPPDNIADIVHDMQSIVANITTALSNTTAFAEQGITSAAAYANHATESVANNALAILSAQAQDLTSQQQAFNFKQSCHFASYEEARTQIEQDRARLIQWEAVLEQKKVSLAEKDEKSKKAQGDEKKKLQKEYEEKKKELEADRAEIEKEREDLEEMAKVTEQAQRTATADRREKRKQMVANILGAASASSRSRPTPSLSAFPSRPPKITQPYQDNFFKSGRKNHIVFDADEDDEDEDDDTYDGQSALSFGTAKSFPSGDLIVETDRFAYDPKAWSTRLSPDVIERTLAYLRRSANIPAPTGTQGAHWSSYILEDHIITLRSLMYTYMAVPALAQSDHFSLALKTILKRIFIFRESNSGHPAAYVRAFSEAVDASERPDWIRLAQRQAKKDATTTTPNTTQKKGNGGGKKSKNA